LALFISSSFSTLSASSNLSSGNSVNRCSWISSSILRCRGWSV
jgi:hypothetical protein